MSRGESRVARRPASRPVPVATPAAVRPATASGTPTNPFAQLGRGKGALYGLTPPPPGWRRVIVKARIARHGTSDLATARTHQHYIMRDGVTAFIRAYRPDVLSELPHQNPSNEAAVRS